MGHLIRTVFVLAIVVVAGAYFLGYLPQTASVFGSTTPPAASPASQDVELPRGATPPKPQASGDELKDRAARAAQRVDVTLAEAALTGKIKAKIALDDTVKTAEVQVHTQGGIVTLTGKVHTTAERDRILQLARETAGVKSVVNEMTLATGAGSGSRS